MDCKTALNETDGDMEAAIDWLRAKGLSKAAKKAGRAAAEGLIAVMNNDQRAVLVEVNSETDFVARNEDFQKLVSTIGEMALNMGGDRDSVGASTYPGSDKSVDEIVSEHVGSIGENLQFRRMASLEHDGCIFGVYVHNAVVGDMGKIGVAVALNYAGDKREEVGALAKQVAMHVAATSPVCVEPEEVPADMISREREVLTEQARQSGKPDNVIEKMIEGRIRKFYEEICLAKQTFVIDGENSVEKALQIAGKELGGDITLSSFVRFALGEGVEKEETDFAAEVAATAGA
jgi:translation elongation factor Ts